MAGMIGMARLTRRAVLVTIGAGAGLIGLGYAARTTLGSMLTGPNPNGLNDSAPPGMMGPAMMAGMSGPEMSTYMDMFDRHRELRRTVEDIPGGVRTVTESNSRDLVAQLHGHVSAMYSHVAEGAEVMCMSASLPTLFRHSSEYQRKITLTRNGVVAVETSGDPQLTQAIRAHAREVSGFVTDGMPAMMRGMMRRGS
jgi:hypothetical protein